MHPQIVSSSALDSLKKEAKSWLRAIRASDPAAIRRLRTAFPGCPAEPCLRDIQHAIALEQNAGSWTSLAARLQPGVTAATHIIDSCYAISKRERSVSPNREMADADWDVLLSEARNLRLNTILGRGRLTDTALERISHMDFITSIQMGNSQQVTSTGLNHLAQMPQLQHLELGGPVTDEWLLVMRSLPELRTFQMCWQTGITDAGVAHLEECEQLEAVNLLGSTCGDGALTALVGKQHLCSLKTGREVTDAGLLYLHEYPRFKSWQNGKPKYSLMSANAGPTHLLIDGPVTDSGLASLVGLEGLFGLSMFWHMPDITAGGLVALADLPQLGFLGCEGKLCDDAAMSLVSALPHLKMLMAQGSVAGDDGFISLSRSGSIEYIWGRECPNLSSRGFAALSNMQQLKGLAVSCKNVDDTALAHLQAFPSLRELMPMDVSDEGFRHIGACSKLEAIWCMYCRDTGDAATESIAGLKKLKSYYAGATQITDRSLEILSHMPSLREISLWKCGSVTDEGIRHLSNLPRLKRLTLDGLSQVTEASFGAFPTVVNVKYSV